MADVKKGDRLRNNDPRKKGEIITVEAVVRFPNLEKIDGAFTHAVYWHRDEAGHKIGRVNRIAFYRIHADDIHRTKGWNLVSA